MCKVAIIGMLKILHNEDFPRTTCYLATALACCQASTHFSLRCSCLICVSPIRGRLSVCLRCLLFEQLEWNLHTIQWRFYFAWAASLSCCSKVTSSLSATPLGRNISQVCRALHCFLTLDINGVGPLPGYSVSACLVLSRFRDNSEKGNSLGRMCINIIEDVNTDETTL